MKCKITFDNGQNIFFADGELDFYKDAFNLSYTLEGDECILSYRDKILTQKRSGEANLFLVFEEGKETLCTLGEGGSEGCFPLFTEKLSVNILAKAVFTELLYVCADENIKLIISAKCS